MDFKALQQLQNQSQNLHARRQGEAAGLYQQGIEAFAQAMESEFRNKAALRTAFDKWMEALKLHRQNPEPYIGLGYIFLILNDRRSALTYFKAAQSVQPDHPDAALMLQHLVELSTAPSPAATPPQTSAPFGDDLDALYDRAEHLLDFHLKQLLHLPGLEPSPERAEIQRQAQLCADQGQILLEIKRLLKIVADEIDTAPLEKQLAVLEAAVKRLETVHETSQAFAALAAEITAVNQRARQALEHFRPGAEAEDSLETLLDDCDRFADRLDAFDAQHYAIVPLEPLYRQLIENVGILQEKLDGD